MPAVTDIAVRSWAARHPFVIDLAIATVVCTAALIFEAADAGEVGATLDPIDFAACAVAAALIVLRRRAPVPVLAGALVAAVWSLIPDDDQGVLRAAACIALYTVAATSDRRTAWIAGAVTAPTLYLAAILTSSAPWYDNDNLELVAWTGVATAVGDAVRSRRAYTTAREERSAALQERAERAEQALQEEGRRQVVEERLRIARELHDVVAHHIAVINVQAGVAGHLLHDDPAAADEALAHVRRGAEAVLDELSTILSVMRQSGESTAATNPLPTLDDLGGLIADFAGAGLDVEWHTTGVRVPLAPAVGLAAYRVVQESLTNAHRYGRHQRARLQVAYEHGAVRIEVENDVDADRSPDSRRGHGIVGMRERVAAAGGTIAIGATDDGRYRVHATFPAEGAGR